MFDGVSLITPRRRNLLKNTNTIFSLFFKGRFEEDHALHGAHQLQAPDGRGPLRPQPQPRRRIRFCR